MHLQSASEQVALSSEPFPTWSPQCQECWGRVGEG